jgi:hypothetical protein
MPIRIPSRRTLILGVAGPLAAGAGLATLSAGRVEDQPAPWVSKAGSEPDALAAELDGRYTQDIKPLLATYCLSCHTGEEAKGETRLDHLSDVRQIHAGGADLRLLREMVSSGEMPPKNKPQPSDHERLTMTQWLDAMIAFTPTDAAIDPGWFTIHRLNRAEYRNTLRDLLDIDPAELDLSAKLPRDDTGYGFDNIADVLSTSPLAIEQYLEAAERAIAAALGPVVECGDHPRDLRPLEGKTGQALPRGGFFLYSNGPATGKFEVPVTGEYLIRVKAWETRGGDENARFSLRVGNRQVQEFSVSGTREDPQEFSVRTKLTKGSRAISAQFLNDAYQKDVYDRNLGIESISVAGPLDETTTERPAVWRRIFDVGTDARNEDARAHAVLGVFASKAYRRPASERQVESLMKLYRAERERGQKFEPAVRTALAATLVSPSFLFRFVARPGSADALERYTLDGYELASRLSYFLWSSMPDEPLMQAAADGSLVTEAGLKAQVKRMLADGKSRAFIENFSGQWLQLRGLESVAIDRERFPEYDDKLRDAMNAEATLFFGDVLRSDRSVLEFLDSEATFLNGKLAKFYGIPGVEGNEFRRVPLPEGSPRGGVLTMGAILTLTSNTTRTSPVKRGLFVLDQILGTPPPPPPADIPPLEQAVHNKPGATVREQLAAHVAVASCAACHNRLDPLGLTFENFDAVGRWRTEENGKPIDASGTLPGGVVLRNSEDLKKTLLSRSDQFVESLSAKVLTYALGRGVEPFDRPAIARIAKQTRAQGDKLSALVESVVLSETFRTCRGRSMNP